MAFNRTTKCSGQVELSNGILVNVDFEYRDSENQPPAMANFNFNLSTSDPVKSTWVNGSFNVDTQEISNYNVSSGIISDEIMNELTELLKPIKTDYKTM